MALPPIGRADRVRRAAKRYQAHDGRVQCLVGLSSQLMLSGADDGEVRVFDLRTNDGAGRLPRGTTESKTLLGAWHERWFCLRGGGRVANKVQRARPGLGGAAAGAALQPVPRSTPHMHTPRP